VEGDIMKKHPIMSLRINKLEKDAEAVSKLLDLLVKGFTTLDASIQNIQSSVGSWYKIVEAQQEEIKKLKGENNEEG
jgi:hypothetical protein